MPSSTRTKSGWVVLLLLLPTCSNEEQSPVSRQPTLAPRIFKPAPSGEVAAWQRATSATAPEGRFLQAMTFDENRSVLLMFGGQTRGLMNSAVQVLQDMWEWSPTTGAWTLRPASGNAPAARAGAAMVFDPRRTKVLLFGGRAASGYNYEDLWEWDSTTGAWTERTGTGKHPAARAQHVMLFQKSTGKVLLFGGGRSTLNTDGTGVSASFGDTWELDSATGTWTELAPAAGPSARHDFGLVWDSEREKAVLFGGMQIDIPGATGVPKQDIWDWDPSTQTWTERTTTGSKPVQRFGHSMAYDVNRKRVVVFGGSDMQTAGIRNDMWTWDPATGTWTQALTGTEAGIPGIRTYASLIYDGTRPRLELVAGLVFFNDTSIGYKGNLPSNEIWELDTTGTETKFSNRSVVYQGPTARAYHAMAYNPATSKVYVFGGVDMMKKGSDLTDLWSWDGSAWVEVATEEQPPARVDAAMAYDPVRQSLILFGGTSWSGGKSSNDTWEWSETTKKWARLPVTASPSERWGHGMVTDTVRKKILLFGGSNSSIGKEIWEWDGAASTWTNRTPTPTERTPSGRIYPVMSFDETRGKLVLYDVSRNPSVDGESTSSYWEWDCIGGGWTLHDPGESLPSASNAYAVYDPIRRRHIFFTDGAVNGILQTWELDANNETWYARSLEVTPGARFRSGMVFDGKRGVAVVFGGNLNSGGSANDTWEYTVKNLALGEGCNAATAATCASGQCVDGVCCETAGCTGACMACNVRGSEGKCVLAQAGTEVPGSCANGQACDGNGTCKSKNGQACTSLADCASGFCVDNICCDSACGPTCKVCNLPGRLGMCTPSPAGSDPKGECVQGTGVCKSTCDGAGACAYPLGLSCGTCLVCDGLGTCTRSDPGCGGAGGTGGTGGKDSSSTKPIPGSGGMGGLVKSSGGVGGKSSPVSGGIGGGFSSTPVNSGGNVGGSLSSSPGGGGGSFSSSPVNSGGNVGGDSSFISSSPGGRGGSINYGGEVGGNSIPSSSGGLGGSSANASGLPRDAGGDGGATPGDAGSPDGGLVGRLSSRGCSCALGQVTWNRPSPLGLCLLGAGLLALRSRRRK